MKAPLILHISMWSQALPLIAGVAARRRLDSPRVWVMLWCALYLISNLVARYLGTRSLNNHFISYVAIPIEGAIILWALSLWQTRPTARLTLRLLIPPFGVAFILLTVLLEDIRTFSRYAEPVASLLALGAAVTTLLTRGSDEDTSLLRQDWFWVCGGLILHFGAIALLTPLANAYLETNVPLVVRAYVVRAYINTLGFALIAVGLLTPGAPRPGHSF